MLTNDKLISQLKIEGIKNINDVHYNLNTPTLYEHAIIRKEGLLSHLGPLVVRTGNHTGRSPNDKFIVKELSSEKNIWWGKINVPFEESKFNKIYSKMNAYIEGKDVYIQDCFAGADLEYKLPIRVITETAWHSLFVKNLFIQPHNEKELDEHKPEFTVINMPFFHADQETDGTYSDAFVIIHFGKKKVIIGGTQYAGEIKKSIFTVLNYLRPLEKVMSMHCSANIGEKNDTAILFGLSGTGKTTLSADPTRRLIGDDEHGWSDNGVFNYEGGCYAKVIRLSKEAEPEIYETTRRFGTVLENVAIDTKTRRINLNDDSLTENTRAAYPLTHIDNIVVEGIGGHPKNIIMLTADAFGVLPPIAKLTKEQAMYHFISGYTAKVAGTETGITEPQATFSTCFGAPFMVLHPSRYAELLGKKIEKHGAKCWLVNTGWTGGPYGEGKRMPIKYTRVMLNSIFNGKLDYVETFTDPFFNLIIPKNSDDVPEEILNPRNTWADKDKYDKTAKKLANMFIKNFEQFKNDISEEIIKSGPKFHE